MQIKLLLPLLFCLAAPAAFGQLAYGLPPNGIGRTCSSNYAYLYNGVIYTCQGADWSKSNPVGTWAAIGNGGGSGITSITLQAPAGFSATPSPFTSNGILSIVPTAGQPMGKVIGTCGAATLFGPCFLTLTDLPGTVLNSLATYTDPPWLSLTWGGGRISGIPAFLLAANNLSDLTNIPAARTALNLGTAALANSTAFEVPLAFTSPLIRTTNTITLNTWGAGTRPVAASALGVSGDCMQWTAAGAGDAGSPCGSGGGGGAGLAAQLGDFQISYVNGQQLTIGANCTTTLPCNVRYGLQVLSITAGSTVNLTGTVGGTIYVYMTSSGVLTVGFTSAAPAITCSGSCTAVTGITGMPNGVIPMGTWVATSGTPAAFATLISSEFRAVYSRDPVLCNSGLVTTPSAGVTTCSIDTTVIPQKFIVTAAPTSISGNLPGDLATDSTNHNEYVCNAPAGTAAPACTSVSTAGWLLVSGGGGGGSGSKATAHTVTFSATPTYTCGSATIATIDTFVLSTALSANVTAGTLSGCTPAQTIEFGFTQAASGGPYTVALPSGFDACPVGIAALSITTMSYWWDGSVGHLLSCVNNVGPSQATPVLFSSLPGCSTVSNGSSALVGDSTTFIQGATITGTGTITTPSVSAYCTGVHWVVTSGSGAGCTSAGISGFFQTSNGLGGCNSSFLQETGAGQMQATQAFNMGPMTSQLGGYVTALAGSSGGTTFNLMVTADASSPTAYNTTTTAQCPDGVTINTNAGGGTINIGVYPGLTYAGVADGTITAGHLLGPGISTGGRLRDLGTTDQTTISSSQCIAGKAVTSTTVGSGFTFQWAGRGVYGSSGGAGNVSNSGTPTVGQFGVWVTATTIQGVTPTGTGTPVAATSPTLVTPNLGTPSAVVLTNATGLPLGTGVSGVLNQTNISAPSLPNPAASCTFTNTAGYCVCTTTCTVTVPVPIAGHQFCALNDDNVSTIITLSALGSSAFYENQARTAYGTSGTGTMTSGGALGDAICIVGRDATHFLSLSSTGTWTAH